METGFPDLVIVVWNEETASRWPLERLQLSVDDLKVMHFLFCVRNATAADVSGNFGRAGSGSLERLKRAEMVRCTGASWQPRALSRCFAASKIVAVEAKVGKWTAVLSQARLNTWFASKSYVLTPETPSAEKQAEAANLGIGICALSGSGVIEVKGAAAKLPRSYASWVLNDLAWRSSRADWTESR